VPVRRRVSSAAERGLPRLASYVAAKHAALGFVRSLARGPRAARRHRERRPARQHPHPLLERTAAAYGLGVAEELRRNQRIGRLLEPPRSRPPSCGLLARASATTGAALGVDGAFTG
jgi:NAD(P)-dependent dehydrogenase (short-subunit alcohol dehydrogenase family)